MSRYECMQAFVMSAKNKSFVATARELGLSPAVITKRIKWLEKTLGVSLFIRTTRHVHLTEAGQFLFASMQPLLTDWENVQTMLMDKKHHPEGKVILGAIPNALAASWLMKEIVTFHECHPKIETKIITVHQPIDFLEQGFHLFIGRDHYLQNTNDIIGRRLFDYCYACFASKTYLEKMKQAPKSVKQLEKYHCLGFTNTMVWQLNDIAYEPKVSFSADSANNLLAAACNGLGIIYAPIYLCQPLCDQGRLVRILEKYQSANHTLKLFYPKLAYQPRKVLVFVEHLMQHAASL